MQNKPRYRQCRVGNLLPETAFLFWKINARPVMGITGRKISESTMQVGIGHIDPFRKKAVMSVDKKVWVRVR